MFYSYGFKILLRNISVLGDIKFKGQLDSDMFQENILVYRFVDKIYGLAGYNVEKDCF